MIRERDTEFVVELDSSYIEDIRDMIYNAVITGSQSSQILLSLGSDKGKTYDLLFRYKAGLGLSAILEVDQTFYICSDIHSSSKDVSFTISKDSCIGKYSFIIEWTKDIEESFKLVSEDYVDIARAFRFKGGFK